MQLVPGDKTELNIGHRFSERDGPIFGVVVTAQGHGRLNMKGYASLRLHLKIFTY